MPFSILLGAHIALGIAGLLLGPVAMLSRKAPGFHPRVGEAILDWGRLWAFLPIALASYAFAFVGYVAAKTRFHGWLRVHVIGQGGSYIAMVTALLVVNWQALFDVPGRSSFWAWAIPTLVGTPIIAWVTREVMLGRRPKAALEALAKP